jgi:aromatic ring-cleaving dioxygenase
MNERLWYTWYEQVPYLCIFRGGVRVLIRPATDADRDHLMNGRISYDRSNDPVIKSWERLAQNGG